MQRYILIFITIRVVYMNLIHLSQTFQKSTTVFDKNCFLRSIEYNLLKAYLIIWSTKVVSSNPADDEVYSIQHYAIKFVSDCGFLRFSPPINWPSRYNRNIVEGGIKHHNSNPIIWLNYQANLGTKSQCTVCIVLIYCIAIFYICINFSEWVIVV